MTSRGNTEPPAGPPPSGGDGYQVVGDDLDNLLPVFEELKEQADELEDQVDEHTSISGDQTGPRVCPEAGDALRTGLQQIVSNIQAFGTHALDIRGAVQATAGNYQRTEEAGADRMNTLGGSL